MKRPNILVITTDQQSAEMMSCAGNQWLETPNMDRIAKRGVRFEQAYAANPVCVPQRYSWWTGRMPSSIGVRQNLNLPSAVPPEVHEAALGHVLRNAGYRTVFGGKTHVPGDLTPQSMGFEVLTADARDRLPIEAADFIKRRHKVPWLLTLNFINPHDICFLSIREHHTTENEKRLMKQATVELRELDDALAARNEWSEDEFFASVCPPLPENHEPQEDEPEAISAMLDRRPFKKHARENWDARAWRLHRWAYHRLTERVDREIGPILDALEVSRQIDDTVVIFTSDHGDHSGSHRLEHKSIFYDEAARVPLLVVDPDAEAPGGTHSALVQTGIDLMATCCDYAGVDSPPHNTGVSFRPAAAGASAGDSRVGIYAENEVSLMYRAGDFKYVLYDFGANNEQLYDLEIDPGETRNALADHPDVARHMSAELRRHADIYEKLRVC